MVLGTLLNSISITSGQLKGFMYSEFLNAALKNLGYSKIWTANIIQPNGYLCKTHIQVLTSNLQIFLCILGFKNSLKSYSFKLSVFDTEKAL